MVSVDVKHHVYLLIIKRHVSRYHEEWIRLLRAVQWFVLYEFRPDVSLAIDWSLNAKIQSVDLFRSLQAPSTYRENKRKRGKTQACPAIH